MSGKPGLRRVLIDYDSTLNPGQANAPLTPERAALLSRYLSRWKGAGVECHVLTSSSISKKTAALRDAGLLELFQDVLSSTEPKRFKSKGDYILMRMKQDGWAPLEQLLADDTIEAVQSVWQDVEGENRPEGTLAHTLRLPQHSKTGLTEEDLQLMDARVFAPKPSTFWHAYAADHKGERFVDEGDSAEKCMLDSLPMEARGEVLRGSPPERQREWLMGRRDSAFLAGVSPIEPPAGAPRLSLNGKRGSVRGAAKAPGPPPPKAVNAKPKAKMVAKSLTGLSGMAELQLIVEATGKEKDQKEAVGIEDVDLTQIDENAKRERITCARCQKEVLLEDLGSHMSSHSSEILEWLFLGGVRNAENDKELTVRTEITHILNVAQECNLREDIRQKVMLYNEERGMGFKYKKLPMLDQPDHDLLKDIDEAVDWMAAARTQDCRNRVLVHCIQGISRSASVCVAFLMKYEGMSLKDAHAHVLRSRAIAAPRPEFVDQLGKFERMLFGVDKPTLTGKDVMEGKALINNDGHKKSIYLPPSLQRQRTFGRGVPPGKAPPPGSKRMATRSLSMIARIANMPKGKAPGPPPPPKKIAVRAMPKRSYTSPLPAKGKAPVGKKPPPPKRSLTSSMPDEEPVGRTQSQRKAPPAKRTSTGLPPGKPPPPKRASQVIPAPQSPPPKAGGSPTRASLGKAPGKAPPRKNSQEFLESRASLIKTGPASPKRMSTSELEGGKSPGRSPGKPPPLGRKPTSEQLIAARAAIDSPRKKSIITKSTVLGRKMPLGESAVVLGAQSEDGSFPASKTAAKLSELSKAAGCPVGASDFEASLSEPGPSFSTFFVLQVLQRLAELLGGKSTDQSATERMENLWSCWGKMHKNPFGARCMDKAREWLQAQGDLPDGCSAVASKLMIDWFTATMFTQRRRGSTLSDEDLLQRQELQRKKSAEVREREAQRAAHWRTLKPANLLSLDWNGIRQTMWCSGGMGGAVLIQFGDSEAVALKPQGLNAVAEAVASELADLVGVRAARMRTVPMLSEEYFSIAEAVHAAPKMEGESHNTLWVCSDTREFVALLEFIPGTVLQGLLGQAALKEGGHKVLEQLGELIAFDCLLNNVDRVPAIWQNEGNLSNVMVASGTVVGIDQQVNSIVDADGREKYFATVQSFCRDALAGNVHCNPVAGIRGALELNCGFALADPLARSVLAGSARCFRRIAERRSELLAALPQVDAKMTATYGMATTNVGLGRLDSMTGFLRDGINRIAQAVGSSSVQGKPTDGLLSVQVQATEVTELCHQIKDMVGELKGCLQELVQAAAGAGEGGAALAAPALQQVLGAAMGMANSAEAAVGKLSPSS